MHVPLSYRKAAKDLNLALEPINKSTIYDPAREIGSRERLFMESEPKRCITVNEAET